jgi:hypothetical protein
MVVNEYEYFCHVRGFPLEQLLGGQELDQLDAGVPFVSDDGACGARRTGLGFLDEPGFPTSAAFSPRSARVKVVMVFLLAAIMPLKLGKRGSLIWSVTDTTAGSEASTVS